MNTYSSTNFYIISFIIIIGFTKGLLAIIGISETITQLLIDFLITLVFIKALYNIFITRTINGPGIIINIFLIALIIISFLLTTVNEIQMVLFFRHFFIYYLLFYAFFNINLSQNHKNKIKNLLIILFSIQVIAAFIKLILIGTGENFIGTISVSEGSLATIMPLFASAYLLSKYMVFKNNNYLIGVFLFILIGLISNKIGILYYIAIIYLYIIFIYSGFKFDLLKKITISIVLLSLLGTIFISLNPRMNPERIIGGSIDINYLIDYTKNYQTLQTRSEIEGDGRFEAPFVAFDKMYNGGIVNTLFGFGPGELVKSSFTKYEKPLIEKYNIGYGGRIGIVWIMMQIGVLGLFIVLYFHYTLFRKIKIIYKKRTIDKEHKVLLLTFQSFTLIFLIDIFTYSPSVINNPAIVITYMFTFFYTYTYSGESNEK